ncbi:hypothetical protein [Exiguobacterium artemiae]|uniref:hypothetical protein n=1 Tax=Exiguobacterium artemiae TaxID=340145 RepID=UPI003CFE33B6
MALSGFASLLNGNRLLLYIEGDGFFSGMPVFMMIFFGIIVCVFVIGLFTMITQGVSTNNLTQSLRHHASELVTPSEDGARQYLDYLRSLPTFPVEKTNLEPFRLAKGIASLIHQTDQVQETTKQSVAAQYARLGILDGDPLADEEPVRRHSSTHHHHDHHQMHINQQHSDHSNHSNF